jgi:hypothetical protein
MQGVGILRGIPYAPTLRASVMVAPTLAAPEQLHAATYRRRSLSASAQLLRQRNHRERQSPLPSAPLAAAQGRGPSFATLAEFLNLVALPAPSGNRMDWVARRGSRRGVTMPM